MGVLVLVRAFIKRQVFTKV